MIQVHVHARHAQIVVVMRGARQPLSQRTRPMIENVAQNRDAGRLVSQADIPGSRLADQIPNCLGSAGIAAPFHHPIDHAQQIVIDGDREALHAVSPYRTYLDVILIGHIV